MSTPLTAAGDTWGIPGPAFLLFFFLAASVLAVAAVVHRRFIFAGTNPRSIEDINPLQVAYLNGGERLAVYAALANLRAAEVVQLNHGRLTVSGSLPIGSTPMDEAVHHAAAQGVKPRDLHTYPRIVDALAHLRQGLEDAGLVVTRHRRHAARFVPLLMLGLLVLGLARLLTGLATGKPVLFLVPLLAIHGAVTLVLIFSVPRQTVAARRALSRLSSRYSHLSPARSPAYATYGPAGAAMGVALFGAASLWTLDPALAAEAEIKRQYAATSGGYYGGGSSCGGGDGGGSSCGGGGCGGGCGG